ncbi:hypothetical protein [Paenibacillus maysiensis]|uniref:hypothetical protein n=1 Tax=Paenibacillus maysiensis TaxID=1155954 RepID=UPI000472F87D|nr:hypothetical protein [Paenibacillus maysiensis]
MKIKKIEELTNQELVDEYGYLAAKEASRVPGPDGRVLNEFERTIHRIQLLRVELLSRMGEPKESISPFAWEQETWAAKVKYSKLLREHLSKCETKYERPLSLAKAIQEAIYLLTTFNEVEHENYKLMEGEGADSPQKAQEMRKLARKEVNKIRAFLRKYTR